MLLIEMLLFGLAFSSVAEAAVLVVAALRLRNPRGGMKDVVDAAEPAAVVVEDESLEVPTRVGANGLLMSKLEFRMTKK